MLFGLFVKFHIQIVRPGAADVTHKARNFFSRVDVNFGILYYDLTRCGRTYHILEDDHQSASRIDYVMESDNVHMLQVLQQRNCNRNQRIMHSQSH